MILQGVDMKFGGCELVVSELDGVEQVDGVELKDIMGAPNAEQVTGLGMPQAAAPRPCAPGGVARACGAAR